MCAHPAPAWTKFDDGPALSPSGDASSDTAAAGAPSAAPAPAPASDTAAHGRAGHDRGDWNVCYLDLHGLDTADVRRLCPVTTAALDEVPHAYHHSFFSALAPHTHVAAHTGPTNKKLRLHVPLVVPPGDGCRLRAGEETVVVKAGECFVFDDSFDHEAWNDSDATRIVLIVDVFHPDLTAEEVKFMRFLQTSQASYMRAASDSGGIAASDDFLAMIEGGKGQEGVDQAVFGTV